MKYDITGKLEGKVAIVTGAGQGIGRGMSIALAMAGAKVVVADINPDTGEAVAEEIRQMGHQAISVQFDLGVEEQCRQMVEAAVKEFGPIDILINNGQTLFVQYDPVEVFPEERWDRTYNTGLKGTWYCSKAVFPHMKGRGGSIINFGSGWGVYGAPGWSDYAGCKEAIRGLSKTMAKEWRQHDIRVNVICPSINSPSADAAKEKFPELTGGNPGGAGDPIEDAGAAAVFLASPDSALLTGHTFNVGKNSVTVQYP